MKKLFILIGLLFLICSCSLVKINNKVFANNESSNSITEEELNNEVVNRIEDVDLSELEEFYENNVNFNLFENKSLVDVIKAIVIDGENIGVVEIFNIIVESIKDEFQTIIKLIILIVVIVGFGSFSSLLNGYSKNGSGISSIVNFFILASILAIVANIIAGFVSETSELLISVKNLMEIIFPILLSLLVTIGGASSSVAFQPVIVLLTGSIIEIISMSTIAVATIYLVISCIGELTENIKLNKLKDFIWSTYKWIIGFIFTIFIGYLSLRGITAGGADKLSIKTAKFAIRSYIPIVGGYMSDSFEIFRIGSVLIKNGLGVVAVVILFSLVIGKIISLVLYNLGFKLASGLSEPLGMHKVTNFLSSISTVFNIIIAGICICFLLCLLTILIIMSSSNI